jgi:hypothetical protein
VGPNIYDVFFSNFGILKSKFLTADHYYIPYIMVNIRKFLLALIPVVGDRPPIFLQPNFAAAVTDDGGINEFLHAIKVSEAARKKQELDAQPCTSSAVGLCARI